MDFVAIERKKNFTKKKESYTKKNVNLLPHSKET